MQANYTYRAINKDNVFENLPEIVQQELKTKYNADYLSKIISSLENVRPKNNRLKSFDGNNFTFNQAGQYLYSSLSKYSYTPNDILHTVSVQKALDILKANNIEDLEAEAVISNMRTTLGDTYVRVAEKTVLINVDRDEATILDVKNEKNLL